MTVHTAIHRIAERLGQIRTNQYDQDCLDCIVDYVNLQDERKYMENLLFAKLFAEKFMQLASTGHYSASDALSEIGRILSMPMEEIVRKMALNVPLYKFEHTAVKYTSPKDPFDFDAIRKERNRIANEHQKELLQCLRTRYTEEQATTFIKNQINIMSNRYNRKEYA